MPISKSVRPLPGSFFNDSFIDNFGGRNSKRLTMAWDSEGGKPLGSDKSDALLGIATDILIISLFILIYFEAV